MFAPSDYSFELPPELIAQEPLAERTASRLLHVTEPFADLTFPDIVELLPANAVVVVNDTRVIPARVLGHKLGAAGAKPGQEGGGKVELLFLEPEPEVAAPAGTVAWRCLARARRPLRAGQQIEVDPTGGAEPGRRSAGERVVIELLTGRAPRTADAPEGSVVVAVPGDPYELLDRVGHVPLPRYIQRDDRSADRERYQTMFAREPGAVAAPTAGLHFTAPVVERLAARGIAIAPLTLHVGYGTFEPIRGDDLRAHRMHRERYTIPEATAELVAGGRPIVALGTTALRALEAASLAVHGALGGIPGAPAHLPEPPGPPARHRLAGSRTTDLFIYPGSGHRFRVVDHLITNFHLPESTLLMLVCAFAGTERVLAAYRHAVAARYRFFSYGDAMLVHRA